MLPTKIAVFKSLCKSWPYLDSRTFCFASHTWIALIIVFTPLILGGFVTSKKVLNKLAFVFLSYLHCNTTQALNPSFVFPDSEIPLTTLLAFANVKEQRTHIILFYTCHMILYSSLYLALGCILRSIHPSSWTSIVHTDPRQLVLCTPRDQMRGRT